MPSHDLQQLRRFIQNAFSDEELGNFCFDYFPQVYNEFTTGMPKSQKVRMLVAQAENGSRLPDLHAALKRETPRAYDSAFPEGDAPAQPEPQPSITRNSRQIFISHASADAEFAQRLAADLRAQNWQTWLAPDSIRPGEKWVEAINRGLTESGVFVLALTESAVNSRWVQTETNAAIGMEHRGEIRLIPISLEDVNAPVVWQAYQWIPFDENYKPGLENLLSVIQPDEMAELRRLYRQFQKAIEKEEWQKGENLGGQIQTRYPDYRETNQLLEETRRQIEQERMRQAKAERLYSQLQITLANQKWDEALNLAEQIQETKPSYRNIEDMVEEAKQGQREQQERERHQARMDEAEQLYDELQVMLAAENWDNALKLVERYGHI
jgi:hypothetical protein